MDLKATPDRSPASQRVTGPTRICRPAASAPSRAATTTGMPWQLPSSQLTSPVAPRNSQVDTGHLPGDTLLDRHHRLHGIGGRIERRHDAVAPSHDDPAGVVGDDLADQSFEVPKDLVGGLLTEPSAASASTRRRR